MTQAPIYQVDSFAQQPFAGNPAAVVELARWRADATLLAITVENNLSNTAFLIPDEADRERPYALRWFTPTSEVDLCGHATLAAGHVVLTHLQPAWQRVVFSTRWAGDLAVGREGDSYVMSLPARPPQPMAAPAELRDALGGIQPEAVLGSRDLIAVLDSAETVRSLAPDLNRVARLADFGLLVTAPGDTASGADFVSRFFAPQKGIPEDPVTGSAHAELAPYWAERLGRRELAAAQLSRRGGWMTCRLSGERVELVAPVAPYLAGTIEAAGF